MNDKQYNDAIIFFKDETGCDNRVARCLAGAADTIFFNLRGNSEMALEAVLFGIRNAYFLGQENAQ